MAVSGPFPVLHSSTWRRPARQASRSIAPLICQTQQPAGALRRVDDRRLRAIDLASRHPTRDADQLPPRGRPRSTGFDHGGDALGGAGEPCEILGGSASRRASAAPRPARKHQKLPGTVRRFLKMSSPPIAGTASRGRSRDRESPAACGDRSTRRGVKRSQSRRSYRRTWGDPAGYSVAVLAARYLGHVRSRPNRRQKPTCISSAPTGSH